MSFRQTREQKTIKTFREKWINNPDLAFSQTLNKDSEIFKWILNRNGFRNISFFKKYLKSKKRILDAGCGNGRVTALLRKYSDPRKTEIIGIDLVSVEIPKKNLKKYSLDQNTKFIQADLMKKLGKIGKFDFIYCQEVLHHTKRPEKAFQNLIQALEKNGEIAIYVYKKKAPIREFVDDFVRAEISKLSYKEAMKICAQITKIGKVLSETKKTVKIPKVDILEIESQRIDLQRFVYHYFMKCFWNPKLSFKDNTAINYDWYHPQLCTRHTLKEIRRWFKRSKLKITHELVDPYGITMRGIKV